MSSTHGFSQLNGKGSSVTHRRKISESGDLCGELRQENADLRRQYQKLVEDLREKITQVDYAEDKIIKLERCIESLKKQHRTVTQPMEKKIDEYRRAVVQQNDALEATKELLRDKTSSLLRLEKEMLELKQDRDAAQSELEKACDEVQWYQNYNTALKSEIRKNQEKSDREKNEDSHKLLHLEQENARITSILEELQDSYKRLEYERNELEEAFAKGRASNDTDSVLQATIYDSDDDIIMDSDLLLGTAFLPVQPGKSLLSEMQSSLIIPKPNSEVGTQTEDLLPKTERSLELGGNLNKTVIQNTPNNESAQDSSIENQHSGLVNGDCVSVEENVIPKKEEWKMLQPIDHRRNTVSMGVIPDEDHEHMIQYAFDVPLRSCNKEAAILSRREWRTLHGDLDQVDQETFKKNFGQEEDTEDVGLYRAARKADDLDEVAESYSEQFPFLVESLFEHLQEITPVVATEDDLPFLKTRFEELAYTFRTDHDQFERREQLVKNEHLNATSRLANLSSSLKRSLLTIRSQKMPGELRELFNNVEDLTATLDGLTMSLDGSAKRVGRTDVLGRVFRLIEVMVLYVRVLKTICGQIVDERDLAKKLLVDAGIPFKPYAVHPRSIDFKENNNLIPGQQLEANSSSPTVVKSKRFQIASPKNLLRRLWRSGSAKTVNEPNSPQPFTKHSRHSNLIRCRDWILEEFTWPWDVQRTWNGIRKGFAMILMLLAILLIVKITSIPSCGTSLSLKSLFGIAHVSPPRI